MKYLKMLGLAAIAAAALTAFMGAGSAQAYTLCKLGVNASGECLTSANGASEHYLSGTVINASSTHATLTVTGSSVGVNEITCTGSTVRTTTNGSGSDSDTAVPGTSEDLAFSGCRTLGAFINTNCTVSTGSNYKGNTVGTGGGNGTLTVNTATETNVVCGGIINCTYQTASGAVQLNLTGGNPVVVSTPAAGVPLTIKAGGSGCGSASIWHASYTGNIPLWVATKDA